MGKASGILRKKFTGWVDVDLTRTMVKLEAKKSGFLIKDKNGD